MRVQEGYVVYAREDVESPIVYHDNLSTAEDAVAAERAYWRRHGPGAMTIIVRVDADEDIPVHLPNHMAVAKVLVQSPFDEG